MYDVDYAERVDVIRDWLEGIENLQQVGRNGLHRYNNSDHSMLTAVRAVENAVLGQNHDIWAVNAESVYHEEDAARRAPVPRSARDARDEDSGRHRDLAASRSGRRDSNSRPPRPKRGALTRLSYVP